MSEATTCESTVTKKPPAIDAVVKRIDEISTLPQVALRLIEVANDPDAGAGDLKVAVERDPALSSRVIRCVNSAAYGLRSRINNLHQAITYLGFNQVRNLALTASVSSLFKKDEAIGGYRRTMLWQHMVSVGLCARLIATRLKMQSFEDAFLGGLLHDIGIIFEDQHCHEHFRQVVENAKPGMPLTEVEEKYLGFDHTRLGARVAEKWCFPPAVQGAIRFHHISENYRGDHHDLVRCVEVANVICTLKGISSVGVKLVNTPMDAFQALGLKKEDVMVLATDLDRELSSNESLFEL